MVLTTGDLSGNHCASCGKRIEGTYPFCRTCLDALGLRGKDYTDWPDWVKALSNAERRDRRHNFKYQGRWTKYKPTGIYEDGWIGWVRVEPYGPGDGVSIIQVYTLASCDPDDGIVTTRWRGMPDWMPWGYKVMGKRLMAFREPNKAYQIAVGMRRKAGDGWEWRGPPLLIHLIHLYIRLPDAEPDDPLEPGPLTVDPRAQEPFLAAEQRIDLNAALSESDEKDWAIVHLLAQGYSQTEAAELVGLTQPSVSRRVRKIQAKFEAAHA